MRHRNHCPFRLMDPGSFGDAGNTKAHWFRQTFSTMRKVVAGAAPTLNWIALMRNALRCRNASIGDNEKQAGRWNHNRHLTSDIGRPAAADRKTG